MRHISPVIALLAAIGVVLFWGGSGLLGHPIGDMPDHYWGGWWFGEELLSGRLPLRTLATHMPEGGMMWHIDPVGALLMLPFHGLGPAFAWNAMIYLQLAAMGGATYSLGINLFSSRSIGFCMALFVSLSPYVLGLIHSGVSEYLGLVWPCLLLSSLLRDGGGSYARTGVLMGLCAWQAFYYGAFAALLVLCLGGWSAKALLKSLKTVVVGTAVAAPAMALGWWVLNHPEAAFDRSSPPGWNYGMMPGTDLLSWFRWGEWYHPDTPKLGNPGILHINYIGWASIAVVLWGAFKRSEARDWLRRCLPFALFSLGPSLSVNRWAPKLFGMPFLLPLGLLYLVPFSPFQMVHHPYRISAFLLPLLAVGLGHGLRALPKAAVLFFPLAMLAETGWLSPAPWPLHRAEVQEQPELGPEGSILDWPPDMTGGNRSYLLAQPVHGLPVAAGVNHFLSKSLLRDYLVRKMFFALEEPMDRARNRDVPHKGPLILPPGSKKSRLWSLGFRWLRVHRSLLSSQEQSRLEKILERDFDEPKRDNGTWIYAIPSPDAVEGP
jgi:hypothetical protein